MSFKFIYLKNLLCKILKTNNRPHLQYNVISDIKASLLITKKKDHQEMPQPLRKQTTPYKMRKGGKLHELKATSSFPKDPGRHQI